MKKLWLIPLKDKRAEEIFSHNYNIFQFLMAKHRVKKSLKNLGYKLKKDALNKEELLILDKNNSLIGKLKEERVYTYEDGRKEVKCLEPLVLFDRYYVSTTLRQAVLESGCSIGYLKDETNKN